MCKEQKRHDPERVRTVGVLDVSGMEYRGELTAFIPMFDRVAYHFIGMQP